MRKYVVWECDVCYKGKQSDEYPKDWMRIEIWKGEYSFDGAEVDVDCCSQACANKAILDYYSKHRLED